MKSSNLKNRAKSVPVGRHERFLRIAPHGYSISPMSYANTAMRRDSLSLMAPYPCFYGVVLGSMGSLVGCSGSTTASYIMSSAALIRFKCIDNNIVGQQ